MLHLDVPVEVEEALEFVSEPAAFDPKAPAELDVPPSAPRAEATLAESPLQRHEQTGTG